MRSELATVVLVWGAVYAYVSFYSLMLWSSRRERRQYATFGLVALGLVVQCVGGVMLIDATDLPSGDAALRIKMAGAAITLAFLHHFSLQLAGRDRPRLRLLGYGWAVVVIVTTTTGLATVAGVEIPAPTWGFAGAPDYREPRMSVYVLIANFFAWVLVASTLQTLYVAARGEPRVRLIFWAVVVNTVAVTHDAFIQGAGLGAYYLSEHAGLLTMWAMAQLLLERFMDTSRQLDVRTRELALSYDELRHTEKALVRKEQLAAVGEISGLIANHVDPPLDVIKRMSTALEDSDLGAEERTQALSSLNAEITRLDRLVGDLLTYARPVQPRMRSVGLAEVIEGVLLTRVPDDGRYRQSVDLDGLPLAVYADPDLLRDALVNVVDNAVQAMPDGGGLSVSTALEARRDEPWLVLAVGDSGAGMDASTRKHAPDPFFTTRPHGTGLGLAIVGQVVRIHGGRVTIRSNVDLGTTVSLAFPIRDPAPGITPPDAGEPDSRAGEVLR